MSKTDSILKIEVNNLKDSINVLNTKIQNIEILSKKVDSLSSSVDKFEITESYFSSILSSQLALFSAVVAVFAILIGLSIWRYFHWKFETLSKSIKETNQTFDNKSVEADRVINEKIETAEKNFNDKLTRQNESLIKIIDSRNEYNLSQIKLQLEIIQNLHKTFSEQYEKQKSDFEYEAEILRNEIYDTDFKIHQSTYNSILEEYPDNFSIPLGWLIGLLEIIIIKNVYSQDEEYIKLWVDELEKIKEIKYSEYLEKNFDSYIKSLNELIEECKFPEITKPIIKAKKALEKIYYINQH